MVSTSYNSKYIKKDGTETLETETIGRKLESELATAKTLQIASIENSISVFTEANIYISIAVLIIGVLIAVVVSKNISKPITDIETVSKNIATLDFSCFAD